MPTVKFVKQKKTVEVPQGANLRREAQKAGIEVYDGIHRKLHCPGLGMCTTCAVRIVKGVENVSRQGLWEKANMLKDPLCFYKRLSNKDELRLSCQTKVNGDIEVETTPAFNWHGENFWS